MKSASIFFATSSILAPAGWVFPHLFSRFEIHRTVRRGLFDFIIRAIDDLVSFSTMHALQFVEALEEWVNIRCCNGDHANVTPTTQRKEPSASSGIGVFSTNVLLTSVGQLSSVLEVFATVFKPENWFHS